MNKQAKAPRYKITKGEQLVYDLKDFILNNRFKTVGTSGIKGLDNLINGFETGKIYVAVAPQGVGKTMLGIQTFHESLQRYKKCAYIATEMNRATLTARIVTRIVSIDENKILKKQLSAMQDKDLDNAFQDLHSLFSKSKTTIVENINRIEDVIKVVTDIVDNGEADFIILDHFHNLRTKDDFYKAMVNAAHDLQELVVDKNIALLILAQMSKQDVKSSDFENIMARGGSDLNDIADVFMILQRDKLQDTTKDPTLLNIYVTKHRWGRTGLVECKVRFPSKTIYDLQQNNKFYTPNI